MRIDRETADEPHGVADTSRRTWRTDQGAASREKLIDAAIDHIAEFGLLASTTTRIAARARLSRGSLQHHFASRDDLLLAVVDRATMPYEVADPGALAARPLEERIEHFYSYYERGTLENRNAAAVTLAASLDPSSEISRRLEHRMESAVRSNEALHARLFANLDVTPEEMLTVVRTTFMMVVGAHHPRNRPEPRLSRPLLRRIQIEMLTAFFRARQRNSRVD